MNIKRYKDEKEDRWVISEPTTDDPTLVVCPKCSKKACVLPVGEGKGAAKVVCTGCGYADRTDIKERTFYWEENNPTDGYFGLDLWLRTSCCNRSLWAFNKRHLTILENFISASLRERKKDEVSGWQNASLASRLPKWIKSAKNRESILKAISDLKRRLR